MFETVIVSVQTRKLHVWLEVVVGVLLPFSFGASSIIRKHVNAVLISSETLTKGLAQLTTRVENKITKMIPKLFQLVFDRLSCSLRYLLAAFASFYSENARGHEQVLFVFLYL